MRPQSAQSGLRGPPLSLCDIIQRGYLHQVPLLVQLGVNLEARDADGRTPLMLAAFVQPETWGVGMARLLIEEGVRLDPRDRHGMNALHHACVYERLELARVLLKAPDFDIVQADRWGNTALHYAATAGSEDLVRLLIAQHRKFRLPLTKVNKQSRNARQHAARAGRQLCAAILQEAEKEAKAADVELPKCTVKADQCASGRPNQAASGSENLPETACSLSREVLSHSFSASSLQSNADLTTTATADNNIGRSSATKKREFKLWIRSDDDASHDSAPHAEGNICDYRQRCDVTEDVTEGLFPSSGLAGLAPWRRCDTNSEETEAEARGLSRKRSSSASHKSHHSPHSTDRPSEGSVRSSGRLGANRPHLDSSIRRLSLGSTNSSRSGTSTRKHAALSPTLNKSSSEVNEVGYPDLSTGLLDAVNSASTNAAADAADDVFPEAGKATHYNGDPTRELSTTETGSGRSAARRDGRPGLPRTAGRSKENADPTARPRSSHHHRQSSHRSLKAAEASTHSGLHLRTSSATRKPESPLRPKENATFLTASGLEGGAETGGGGRSRAFNSMATTTSGSSRAPLMPFEKNSEQVIHLAPDTDFRNSPEYVLKLTRLEWSPAHMHHADSLPALLRPTPGPPPPRYDDDRARQKPSFSGSWRDNMRFLYRHYEYQCSPSWRIAAKPPPAYFVTLSPPHFGSNHSQADESEECKDRKSRRPSSFQRPGAGGPLTDASTSSSSLKRRPPSSLRQRKTSANSPPVGGDTATASSGESSSTGGQTSRKRSEIRQPDPGVLRQ